MPDEPKEPIDIHEARIKKLAKEGKIGSAPSGEIDEYGEEVAWILAVIAVETNQPGVLGAFVTDPSSVSDFFDLTWTKPAREYFRGKIEGRIGVSSAGTLVDMAKRVRELWASEKDVDDDEPSS